MRPYVVSVAIAGRRHRIVIGDSMASRFPAVLKKLGLGPHVAIVTDASVARRFLAPLRIRLERAGFALSTMVVQPGERRKSLRTLETLSGALLRAGLGRDGCVLALGGGVVGDLAGFLAATYQRGIPIIQVPTTLLAQVDSSIGGKVGVNHALGKNMIGAFHQPALVWSDTAYLRTLPRRELIGGLGEVIKYGIIRDRALFAWLERHLTSVLALDRSALRYVVRRSAALKARVVAADEHERGERMILNHGHTIGHAIEAAAGYERLRHGESVLLGMKAETLIASRLGLLPDGDAARILALIDRVPVPRPRVSLRRVLGHMGRDKKNRRGAVRFVLATSIGHVRLVDGVDPAVIVDAIRATLPTSR